LAHAITTSSIATAQPIFRSVTSRDGTRISYQSIGTGPSLIIIPGAMSLADDFVPLASEMADTFSTHIIERRGRGLSGEMGADYSITKECEDVIAVQQATDAHLFFGHSYGGLVAFEAARNNKTLRKLAVYEPGISINHSIPTDWMSAYQVHLDAENKLGAFIDFIRGMGPAFMKWIPDWWLRRLVPRMIGDSEWGKMAALLPGNLIEHKEVARLDNTYPNYREVSADVLLMSGGKGPGFRGEKLQIMSGVLAHCASKIFPKLDHFGPTHGAPFEVAQELKAFFSDDV
jgi:pimeloyl-ACP methyl ester carboxylesterase